MSRRLDTNLLTNALTGSGSYTPLARSRYFTVSVKWGAHVTAGAVVIETAPSKSYTGTWNNKTTFTIGSGSTAGAVDEWRGQGPFGGIRARITSDVDQEGVTVDVSEN